MIFHSYTNYCLSHSCSVIVDLPAGKQHRNQHSDNSILSSCFAIYADFRKTTPGIKGVPSIYIMRACSISSIWCLAIWEITNRLIEDVPLVKKVFYDVRNGKCEQIEKSKMIYSNSGPKNMYCPYYILSAYGTFIHLLATLCTSHHMSTV